MEEPTVRGMRYLLELAPEAAQRICRRLRIDPEGPVGPTLDNPHLVAHTVRTMPWIRLWVLRQDHPEMNRLLCRHGLLSAGATEDLHEGLLFGPGRSEPGPTQPSGSPRAGELIDRLRQATGSGSLAGARAAAGSLRRADWPLVAAAHQERPFPGYACWALAEQVDCPAELRTAFGTHRKFEHRLRQAGLTGGPADCLDLAPAGEALGVLGLGRVAFPALSAEVEDVLRPLLEREVGADEDAWAMLAHLLPTFAGTLPELIRTTAAIVRPAPELAPKHWPVTEREAEPVVVPPQPVAPAPAEPSFWQGLASLFRWSAETPVAAPRTTVRPPAAHRPMTKLRLIAADPKGWEGRVRRAVQLPGSRDAFVVHWTISAAELPQLRRYRRVVRRMVSLLPPELRATYLVGASVEQQRFWIALFAELPR
ncbi:hypothetical protein KCMC57_up51450 [Kitasatospora sp. CMC57]|uniref:Uncharacterized protein n=1 Tax=Kitasatospora sp. CMC57 TaxID=3231513 RepID=A0AB33K516_9ACTN